MKFFIKKPHNSNAFLFLQICQQVTFYMTKGKETTKFY